VQIVWDPGMTVEEYAGKGRGLEYPVLGQCPMCAARVRLVGDGWYRRNGLPSLGKGLVLFIGRALCPVCRRTASFLPSFLVAAFQYTARFIVATLEKKAQSYRQLLQFHRARFLKHLNTVQAFFRNKRVMDVFSKDESERPMRLLRMIEESRVEEFSMLYHKRFRRSFMAK